MSINKHTNRQRSNPNPKKIKKQNQSQMRPRKNPETAPKGAPLEPSLHNPTPETNVRVNEVAKKISLGWTKFEVTEWVKEEYDVKDSSANRYWNAALNKLTEDCNDTKYIQEMKKKTISILDKLVHKEIEEGRYKEANQSIDLLSKFLGYNIAKTETKLSGELHFNFGKLPDNQS